MQICVEAVDRYLARTGRESGVIVVIGGTETYAEALALYLARDCSFRLGENSYIGYIAVHDNTDHAYNLSKILGFDLEALEAARRALVRRAETIHEILEAINTIPDGSIIIVDATAGSPHGINSELLEDMFNRVRLGRVKTKMFFLINNSTWEGFPLSLVAELADVYIELSTIQTTRGIDRVMEFRYARGTLMPYIRIYYTIGPEGVQLSMREEV
jgi:hypothetical protein